MFSTETLISRSVAAPALENRFRASARDQGTDFHEPAFFNQLVDFSDSCSDDIRSCHAALLGRSIKKDSVCNLHWKHFMQDAEPSVL